MRRNMHCDGYAISREWKIVCDFDGTITPFDVTDALLARFADKQWENIEREWEQGGIPARQCMEEQVRLIRATRTELDEFLDTVPVRDGFHEFIDLCGRHSLPVIVVSDGIDYCIRRILGRHRLGRIPVISNRLLFTGPCSYRLDFPHGATGCPSGVCKCAVAHASPGPFLLVGDGRSDCCLARTAALTLAQRDKELERLCAREDLACLPYSDFFEVASLIAGMLHEPVMPHAPGWALQGSAGPDPGRAAKHPS